MAVSGYKNCVHDLFLHRENDLDPKKGSLFVHMLDGILKALHFSCMYCTHTRTE